MTIALAYLVIYAMVFLFGSTIGSFLNVVIYRLPLGISPAAGRSYCPCCKHRLSVLDMIPVLGWLLLRGRCRYCAQLIAPRYPLVEALVGVQAVVAVWQFGYTPQALLAFAVMSIVTAIAFIDADTMTIPDSLVVALGIVAFAAAVLLPQPGWGLRFAGLFAVSLPLLLIALVVRDAFGGGDIKLMAAAGFYLGLQGVLVAFFVALMLGGCYGGWLLLRRNGRGKHFAFGPFLAVGIVFAIFYGHALFAWYMGMIF